MSRKTLLLVVVIMTQWFLKLLPLLLLSKNVSEMKEYQSYTESTANVLLYVQSFVMYCPFHVVVLSLVYCTLDFILLLFI